MACATERNGGKEQIRADAVHRYLHLNAEPAERRAELADIFYRQIYRDAFPNADQAEDPDVWLPLMGDAVTQGQPAIHMVLARNDVDKVLGGVVFERYGTSRCWLMTYLAVHSTARRRGVAAGLMAEVVRIMQGCDGPDGLLLAECEDPARVADARMRALAERRISILGRLGLRRLLIEYVQPALGSDKQTLDDLLLLCRPTKEITTVPAGRLAAFLIEFYAALGQSNAPYLNRVRALLAVTATVSTVPLDAHLDTT